MSEPQQGVLELEQVVSGSEQVVPGLVAQEQLRRPSRVEAVLVSLEELGD